MKAEKESSIFWEAFEDIKGVLNSFIFALHRSQASPIYLSNSSRPTIFQLLVCRKPTAHFSKKNLYSPDKMSTIRSGLSAQAFQCLWTVNDTPVARVCS